MKDTLGQKTHDDEIHEFMASNKKRSRYYKVDLDEEFTNYE